MSIKPTLILSLLCGALLPYAFAPYNFVPLAVIGLGGWLYLFSQQEEHTFKLGWAFGFGWFGFGGWWLADTFHIYGHLPYISGLLVVALFGLIMGLFFASWAWLAIKLKRQQSDLLWLFPLIGIFEEWLRSFLFTGLPWTALGDLLLETPAASWMSVFGSYGTGLLLLFSVSSLVSLQQRNGRYPGLIALGVCAALFFFSPHIEVPEQPTLTAALVQPNIPQDQKWDYDFLESSMFRLATLSAQAGEVDLIVWPEAAVPMYLSKAPGWNDWLTAQMNSWQTAVAFGGIKLSSHEKSQNVLYLAETNAKERQFVGKHHLVPFGEYVPSWLPWLEKLVPDIGDFEQANDNGILTTGAQRLGSLICYESIFSGEAAARVNAGANVLIVVTNDAWYDTSPAAWQHLQAAQVRAIETGRYVLRAANTGVSAIISPDGNIQQTMPWWQDGVVKGRYQPLTHFTLYQQWGDLPVLILVFSGLGFAGFRFYRSKR